MKWLLKRTSRRGPFAMAINLVRELQATEQYACHELMLGPGAACAVLEDRGLYGDLVERVLDGQMSIYQLHQAMWHEPSDPRRIQALAVCLAVELEVPLFCVTLATPPRLELDDDSEGRYGA